jgi:hypothetical protein
VRRRRRAAAIAILTLLVRRGHGRDRAFAYPHHGTIASGGFDRALTQQGIGHLFRTYPGGHSSSLWRSQAQTWLGYALSALAVGRSGTFAGKGELRRLRVMDGGG